MMKVVEILILILLSSLITVFVNKVFKRFIKIKALLWLVNSIVFICILGAELLILQYFQQKYALRDFNYEGMTRYEPYYAPQENAEKK